MSTELIVNADDFGYFDGVSAGILEAIGAGVVTATGVMANGPAFPHTASVLRAHPEVDVGVHLNLTHGSPVTREFAARQRLGVLPDKRTLVIQLFTGRLPLTAVAGEWRAQIERCLAADLQIRFLNSHEHVHMLPVLYPAIVKLAREFDIRYVRYTNAEMDFSCGASAALRSLALKAVGWMHSPQPGNPELLGLAASGRLNMLHVSRMLSGLHADGAYELMCHPGHDDPGTAAHPALRRYHDWRGELACLLSVEFHEELRRRKVRLVRFRDLA